MIVLPRDGAQIQNRHVKGANLLASNATSSGVGSGFIPLGQILKADDGIEPSHHCSKQATPASDSGRNQPQTADIKLPQLQKPA